MTLVETITGAVEALVTGLDGLPAPVRDVDDPKAADYQAVAGSANAATQFLALLTEKPERRPGCPPLLGGGGVVYDWDLNLVAAYACRTADEAERAALRDGAQAALGAALQGSGVPRALTVAGQVVWLFVGAPELPANVRDAEMLLGVVRLPVTVWFTAGNPAL